MGKSTKNLVVDATNREEIKNILIQSIEKIKADYTSIERIDYKRNIEDIMMVIEEILGKKFINFYGLVIAEIVSQELFQKEN
jgi:nicotinamide riboside kinase